MNDIDYVIVIYFASYYQRLSCYAYMQFISVINYYADIGW